MAIIVPDSGMYHWQRTHISLSQTTLRRVIDTYHLFEAEQVEAADSGRRSAHLG